MWKTLSRGTIIYAKCDAPKNYVDNVLSKCIWMYEWCEIKFCGKKSYPGINWIMFRKLLRINITWLHMFHSSFLTKYIRIHKISACNTLWYIKHTYIYIQFQIKCWMINYSMVYRDHCITHQWSSMQSTTLYRYVHIKCHLKYIQSHLPDSRADRPTPAQRRDWSPDASPITES